MLAAGAALVTPAQAMAAELFGSEPAVVIVNDDRDTAAAAALPFEQTVDLSAASSTDVDAGVCGDLGDDVWFRVTISEDTNLVVTAGSGGIDSDPALEVWADGATAALGCNDDEHEATVDARLVVAVTPGTYEVRVGSVAGAAGTVGVSITTDDTAVPTPQPDTTPSEGEPAADEPAADEPSETSQPDEQSEPDESAPSSPNESAGSTVDGEPAPSGPAAEASVRLTGVVRAQDSGVGIGGVCVELVEYFTGVSYRTVTSPTGLYGLRYPQIQFFTGGDFSVNRCAPSDPEFLPYRTFLTVQGSTWRFNVSLRRAPAPATIHGVVVDDAGDPIEGVCVRATGDDRKTRTSITGAYQLKVRPGVDVRLLFADCDPPDGFPRYRSEWFDDSLSQPNAVLWRFAPGESVEANASLARVGAIAGEVTDDHTGAAVHDVCVDAINANDEVVASTRTYVTGGYLLTGLLPGAYSVRFSDCGAAAFGNPRWAEEYYDDTSGPGTPVVVEAATLTGEIDAGLDPGGVVTGVVTDFDTGEVLPNKCVYGRSDVLVRHLRTSPTGHYRLTGFEPGATVQLSVLDCFPNFEHQTYSSEVELAIDEDTIVDVALRSRYGRIVGTVTDAFTGELLENICVQLNESSGEWYGTTSTVSGSFGFRLRPGQYRVTFLGSCPVGATPFYESKEYRGGALITVFEGETVRVDDTLRPNAIVEGVVSGVDGQVIRTACVRIFDALTGGRIQTRLVPSGVYRFYVRPGRYQLSFDDCSGQGYASEWWEDAVDRANADSFELDWGERRVIDASLDPAGSISGRVTDHSGRRPLPFTCVDVFSRSGEYLNGGWVSFSGTYRIDSVPAGDWIVRFDPLCERDGNSNAFRLPGYSGEYWPDARSFDLATPVRVESGFETSDIDARLERSGSITGTLRDRAGNEVFACVTLHRVGERSMVNEFAWHEVTGAYRFDIAWPGDYRVRFGTCPEGRGVLDSWNEQWWNDATSRLESAIIRVSTGSTITGIDSSLDAPFSISGTVSDAANGDLLDNVCVTAIDDAGKPVGYGRTSVSGTYTLAPVLGARVRVGFSPVCRPDGGLFATRWYGGAPTAATATIIDAAPGERVTGIDGELQRAATIEGAVTDDFGAPQQGTCVEAIDVHGDVVRQAFVSETGGYRLTNLNAGEHRVRFGDCHFGESSVRFEYWPGVDRLSDAMPISLTPGELRSGIDAVLGVGGAISGRVTAPLEVGFCVRVTASDGTVEAERPMTTTDRGYMIRGLAPGEYRVGFVNCRISDADEIIERYYENSFEVWNATEVEVRAGEVTNGIDAVIEPRSNIAACNVEHATHVGTSGDDVIIGTEGRDVVLGLGGDDTIFGLGGDDVICGGSGNDFVDGGSGADVVDGGLGRDTGSWLLQSNAVYVDLRAGRADDAGARDRLHSLEIIVGSAHDDVLIGNSDAQMLVGGAGNDILSGLGRNDLLVGGSGNDWVLGGSGDDDLFGDEGTDVLIAGPGVDDLDGGIDHDVCFLERRDTSTRCNTRVR